MQVFTDQTMKLCTSAPSARGHFHTRCLLKKDFVENPQQPNKFPQNIQFKQSFCVNIQYYSHLWIEDDSYLKLPGEAVELACLPIVCEDVHGITGNIQAVMQAQEMVFFALSAHELISDNWMEDILTSASEIQAFIASDNDKFICPACKGVI